MLRHALVLVWAAPLCLGQAPQRVAIFRDTLPGLDNSALERTAAVLRAKEFAVTGIGIAELGSKETFNSSAFDVLVLNHSDRLTAPARENIQAFTQAGGDLVMLGPEGFVQRSSMVLPAFSRYEPYEFFDAESVTPAEGQDIIGGVEAKGRLDGRSAIGFSRRKAKFVPLLAARDRYGRVRGWAAGLLSNFAEYPGSDWLLFGIRTPQFYQSDAFAQTLTATLARMRGDALARAAQDEQAKSYAVKIKLTTPAPHKEFVRVSPDGKRLIGPGGKPLFMIGLNYHRSLDEGEWWSGAFDDRSFEDDFRKAREAGVNCIRLGTATRFYDDPELVKECARKYGIYLVILLNWGTRQDFVANAERVARMYADEPMVLGYDIENEPQTQNIAGLKMDETGNPATRFRAAERYAGQFDRAATEAALAGRMRRGTPALSKEDLLNAAALSSLWSKAIDPQVRGSGSTFPALTAPFRVAKPWEEAVQAVDDTFGEWIRLTIAAIRKYDKNHLISVGYNSPMAALSANRQLDFQSHHVYDWPLSYEMVMSNLTTMDRLAALFPDKPVTLGEFGYTNGLVMPDGRYLDFQTSAVGEMMHFLYSLAHGYNGCLKWVLTDWHWDIIGKQGDRGRPTQIYEAYFGMYWYDGNPKGMGRPKPVAHTTRFLREYIDRFGAGGGGTIEIRRARNPIGAGYVFRSKNALFVGRTSYQSPELEFTAPGSRNVMLMWDRGELKAMASGDTQVTVRPSRLGLAGIPDGVLDLREGQAIAVK